MSATILKQAIAEAITKHVDAVVFGAIVGLVAVFQLTHHILW